MIQTCFLLPGERSTASYTGSRGSKSLLIQWPCQRSPHSPLQASRIRWEQENQQGGRGKAKLCKAQQEKPQKSSEPKFKVQSLLRGNKEMEATRHTFCTLMAFVRRSQQVRGHSSTLLRLSCTQEMLFIQLIFPSSQQGSNRLFFPLACITLHQTIKV